MKTRVLPHAPDMELAVLGTMMFISSTIPKVYEILTPDSFYKDAHKIICEAIYDLFKANSPVDTLTVIDALKKSNKLKAVGGEYYLTQVYGKAGTSVNIEYHARIVAQEHYRRLIITKSYELIESAHDPSKDIFETTNEALIAITQVTSHAIGQREVGTNKLFDQFEDHILKTKDNHDNQVTNGIATTLPSLDKVTGGWQNTDLIVIAGRPAMGKTALTKSCLQGAARQGIATYMFSLEMSHLQLVSRIVSEATKIPSNQFMQGNYSSMTLEKDMADAKAQFIGKDGEELLFIQDEPVSDITTAIAKAKRAWAEKGIGLFVFDYIQLANAKMDKKNNREQEISHISRSLKMLAKETKTPVIALSQLSRGVESRPASKGKKPAWPQLSDLRESGAIEQDADIVAFLYRPEYYLSEGDTIDIDNKDNVSPQGWVYLIIAKHRHGGLKDIPLRFTDYLTRFSDPADEQALGNLKF